MPAAKAQSNPEWLNLDVRGLLTENERLLCGLNLHLCDILHARRVLVPPTIHVTALA